MGDSGTATLRVSMADGTSRDDPSEDALLHLLDRLGPGNQYLIVDRIAADGHFMQVYREADGTFAVEYRDGSEGELFETLSTDPRKVHAALTGWAFDRTGWREAFAWHPCPL